MFFLIDADDGEVRKASETIEELKKNIDPKMFYEDDVWIMEAEVVDGNFVIPVKDLVGNCLIYDLFKSLSYEEEK